MELEMSGINMQFVFFIQKFGKGFESIRMHPHISGASSNLLFFFCKHYSIKRKLLRTFEPGVKRNVCSILYWYS